MLKIKRVPTVVSNYQKDEASDESVGCGRNCLGACCLNGARLPLYACNKLEKSGTGEKVVISGEAREPPVAFLESLVLEEWEDRFQRGLFRYDVTACETKVIPGKYGFVAQLNEGRHLKKRPTEFRVDKVLQSFDGNKFNFTKVGQEELLFQFEAGEDCEAQFFPCMPVDAENSPSVVAINVSPIEYGHVLLIPRVLDCLPQRIAENLKRLQSLLFGADQFLEKSDFSSAQILGLRLLGFLDSRSVTEADRAFIAPIRREVASKVDSALEGLVSDSDRQAFELAKTAPGPIFGSKGEFDVEKIKQSKHFHFHHSHSNRKGIKEMEERLDARKLIPKASKPMMQARLTSLYGNSMVKPDNQRRPSVSNQESTSEECVIVERSHGVGFGTKRAHAEISNLTNHGEKEDGAANGFVSAKTKLEMDARQKRGSTGAPNSSLSPQGENNASARGYGARSGGYLRRGYRGNFVPPVKSSGNNVGNTTSRIGGKTDDTLDDSTRTCLEMLCGPDGELPEKLRNLEPRLIEHVSNEIMDRDPNVRWDDIAGLEHAKKCVTEMVIWPLLRPDIFKGCRSPGKGLLLFGPPGTGKTMIGKAIAGEAKATFFYISASSLTSKWIGEGEKLVRALFGVASCRQPAVIFVDEIDSLLSQRKSDGEHESSRRLKTQFLIEMEGFDSGSEQILLIGATNRPQELDEAARRRLTKRLYIPLPSSEARAWIIQNLLQKDGLFTLSEDDMNIICKLTEGYSGSDMKNLVKDATMGPLREALKRGIEITNLTKDDMRLVTLQDFKDALQEVRPSVSQNELGIYDNWNNQFGSLSL